MRTLLLFGCLGVACVAQSALPPPPVPAGNPMTAGKVLLGKALFWDEQLSSSNGMACGTCHVLRHDGTDPRAPYSINPGFDGVYGTADDVHGSPGVPRHDRDHNLIANSTFGVQWQVSRRRAPSVINAAYLDALFVDGRSGAVFRDPVSGQVLLPAAAALEHQVLDPLVSDTEMAHLGRTWTDVVRHIAALTPLAVAHDLPPALHRFVAGHTYDSLFGQVFGSPGVTPTRVAFAIAAYERTLISDGSPFDAWLSGQGTLTPLQARGLAVFDAHCASCHTDLDPGVRVTGPTTAQFRNTGVRPAHEDVGRMAVTNAPRDRGRFRVPGLRNVALRTSYFHNGGAGTLAEVIDFYNRGGDFNRDRDALVTRIRGRISAADKAALLALLQALTDPRVAAEQSPFDRPGLWLEGPLVPTAFGTGTPGSVPQSPRIAALGTAYFGNDVFGVGVDNVAPGLFTALLVDLTPAPAPVLLYGQQVYLGQSPALLSLAIGLSEQAPDGSGFSSHVFHVPPAAAAPGTYWLQWLILDPGGPHGFASSDAMRLVIPQ